MNYFVNVIKQWWLQLSYTAISWKIVGKNCSGSSRKVHSWSILYRHSFEIKIFPVLTSFVERAWRFFFQFQCLGHSRDIIFAINPLKGRLRAVSRLLLNAKKAGAIDEQWVAKPRLVNSGERRSRDRGPQLNERLPVLNREKKKSSDGNYGNFPSKNIPGELSGERQSKTSYISTENIFNVLCRRVEEKKLYVTSRKTSDLVLT